MDIRGSYKFTDIRDSFNIPLADLGSTFQLSENQAAAFKAKELESIDFGNSGRISGRAQYGCLSLSILACLLIKSR